jgi:exodeoxyribonuclease III
MRIATYNVNGINGRLTNLLERLKEAKPDIVCLQELKAPDDKFPAAAIRADGYGAFWQGQKSWNGAAILARGGQPVEIRRGLPGDPDDTHSRYNRSGNRRYRPRMPLSAERQSRAGDPNSNTSCAGSID